MQSLEVEYCLGQTVGNAVIVKLELWSQSPRPIKVQKMAKKGMLGLTFTYSPLVQDAINTRDAKRYHALIDVKVPCKDYMYFLH